MKHVELTALVQEINCYLRVTTSHRNDSGTAFWLSHALDSAHMVPQCIGHTTGGALDRISALVADWDSVQSVRLRWSG